MQKLVRGVAAIFGARLSTCVSPAWTRRLPWRRYSATLICGLFAPLSAPSIAQPAQYDVAKVRAAMRSPLPNLVLLSAHRGLWRDRPENTLEAIQAAVDAGYESVEIDVRLSLDGTLWLIHDFELGRLTNGVGYVTATKDTTLAKLSYRDRNGDLSQVGLQTFDDALTLLGKNLTLDINRYALRGFVLVVDLKSPPGYDPNFAKTSGYRALQAAWQRVQEVSKNFRQLGPPSQDPLPVLGAAIVFKMKAKEFPDPSQLEQDLKLAGGNDAYLHVEPVMHPDDQANGDRVLKDYFEKPYTIGFEAVAEYIEQPVASNWIKVLQNQNRTLPGFPSWNDYPEGVAASNGECCVYRVTQPDPLRPNVFPDYSGSWDFQLQLGANWLTADTAPFLDAYLRARGLRQTDQLR